VLQEIFGVNGHIKSVTNHFAEQGYVAIAPAFFDRQERGVELSYGEDDYAKAVKLYSGMSVEHALADTAATIEYATRYGRVGVVGYCFGGLIAWLAACKAEGLNAAVGYYGGGITDNLDLTPRVPTQLHFGASDAHIPVGPLSGIQKAHPQVEVFIYEGADHGFNCNERPSYNAAAAAAAGQRTLQFLRLHVG
jgi:carboxymethylenebutenolidase